MEFRLILAQPTYLRHGIRESLRCSAINPAAVAIKITARVALKLPEATQLMQVPIIAGISDKVLPSTKNMFIRKMARNPEESTPSCANWLRSV